MLTKRVFDIVVSASGLVLLVPIFVVVSILVLVSSGRPVFFRQSRLGKNKQPFKLIKYRTMDIGTQQLPTHEVDPRAITGLGRVLRATHLDELPQLWNVLRGDMSLVGPRPCLPSQNELISQRERHDVFAVLPGITGLAQVRGVDMRDPKKLAAVDGEYRSNRSTARDAFILFRTFWPGNNQH